MRRLASIVRLRLRSILSRRNVEQELDEELRYHLERQIEAERATGRSPEEARYAALQSLRDIEQRKEECRDMRKLNLVENLLKDLRYASRMIRRSPGFTAVAILSLALGIGANTAIFTLIDAVMLRSLPVRSPNELVTVGDASRPTAHWDGGFMSDIFSYPLYQRLRDQNRVFSGLLASGNAGLVELSAGTSGPEPVRARLVSGNYFGVLGVSPALGRTFPAAENRTASPSPVIVISYDYWTNHFAHDPGILGKTLTLNGSPFTVIGVAPQHFTGEVVGSPSDVWIPLSMQPQINRGDSRLKRRDSNWLLLLGRLKPGISLSQARAEITTLVHQAIADFEGPSLSPDRLREIRSEPVPVEAGGKGFSWVRKHDSALLFTLMAVVGLVLLIACANIANLLLTRATVRQREISVRLAVGGSRARLIRQLLTESGLLAAIGAVSGVLVASWGSRILARLASIGGPHPVPFDVDVHPNATVLALVVVISILTTILFGLVPALRSTRVDVVSALKENARTLSGGGRRLGKLLVIGQVALSLLLLIAAGLFIRSFINLETKDIGYSRTRLLLLQIDPLASGSYRASRQIPLMRSVIERLRSIPGVQDATVSENGLFANHDSSSDDIRIEGFTPRRKQDMSCTFDQIGPRYFQVLGVPILAGRDFNQRDDAREPLVAIINETMARFYFGKRNSIGNYIHNGGDRYEIVGVVRDTKQGHLKDKTERRFYGPLLQTTDRIGEFNFEIRTQMDPSDAIPSIRREIQSYDRSLNVLSLTPVRLAIDQSVRDDRMIAQLCGFFGILALVLAATGLYGVMAYATSRRTNEIGVRMAMGAERASIVWMILRETLLMVAMGIGIGLPVALAATRLISAMLVGLSAKDPIIIGIAIFVMVIAGTAAGIIPAARASRIDPMVALRQE